MNVVQCPFLFWRGLLKTVIMARRNSPFLPLYVDAFMSDERLAECSARAHGVYIRIMCLMHKSVEYGKIALSEKDLEGGTDEDSLIVKFALKLSRHLPFGQEEIEMGLRELIENGCLHIDGNTLYQKRMIRDGSLSERRANAGQKGMAKRYSQTNEIPQTEPEQKPEEPEQKPAPKPKKAKPPVEKKQYAEFVRMTEAEYAKLVNSHGEDGAKELVEILDNYKASSGKRYKDDYRAILTWCVDKYLKRNNNLYGSAKDKLNNAPAAKAMERDYEEGF